MAWWSSVGSRSACRKGAIAGLVVAAVYIAFGFLILPAILKSVLPKTLSGALHRKVAVRDVRVNPLELSVTVRGLEISERDASGTWVSAGEIFANLQLMSVVRGGPILSEVRFSRPYIKVVRRPDGSYNFTDLIEEFSKKPKPGSKPLKYSFNNIRIVDGQIDFDDLPKKTRHEVRGIHLAVPFVSNLPYYVERYIEPSLEAVVNGKALSLKGKSKPFSDTLETAFDVNIKDLDIPYYLAYLPFPRPYEVPSAFLDTKVVVSFQQFKDKPPAIRVEGDVILREIRITGKDNSPMIRLPRIQVKISPSDLAAREIRIAGLQVKEPEVDARIDRNGLLNLLLLIPENEKEKSPGENVDTKLYIDSVRLQGGKVGFADSSRPTPFRTSMSDVRIDVDRLSTERGKKADVAVSLSTESGERLEIKGTLSMAPVASEGKVTLAKAVLKKYAPYYADSLRFDVREGTLDLSADYRFALADRGSAAAISGLAASISNLRLRQREEQDDFLRIPVLSVMDGGLDLDKKEIRIGEFSTGKGTVTIRRRPGGEMNVGRLVPEKSPAPVASPGRSSPGKPAGERAAEKPWVVTLKKAAVQRYVVRFEDRTTDPPVEIALEPFQLVAENVTTERNRKGKVTFSTGYNREGSMSLSGAFGVDPPSASLKVLAKSLPIGPLQPYFSDKIRILVTGGAVSAQGTLSAAVPEGGPPRVSFLGEFSVNDFSSLDKARGEEFLKFATLHIAGMEAGYNPSRLTIGEVSLADFYSRIIVNPDGSLNVQGIVSGDAVQDNAVARPVPAAAPADNAAVPSMPVRIETVTLQGGTIQFSDKFVKPNYSASLVEVGGRVTGLSSEESLRADVDLRGKLSNAAPLEIAGKVNPLAKELFLDLKVDFRDMDLSPLSPYSGRFAGYMIQKGKLTLSLKYHIERRKLDAENRVFLDQFTFGETVDSPDATRLPVRLAVALLKDRKGEIHLDLPVTGQIDDPKFSIWGIVWKIVGNLLVKAATSPFALLGAIFGGGEELSYLEFEPGLSAVPATEEGKLGNLAKVLLERPGLKLEIEGHVDPERDKEGLRGQIFRRKLIAQKVKALVKAGQAAPATDNVRVEAAEYPKYLASAYKEEKFPKPRNIIGMAKELPVPEMEKLMLTHIQVTGDDLRQLAVERGANVRDRLLAGGKVEPGRVFLVEPKTPAPEKKEKLKDSRVDFRIR